MYTCIGKKNFLLYADKVITMADSPSVLHYSLSFFEKYCIRWKLKVNLIRTKVVIVCKN